METMNAETDDWLKSNDSKDYFELLKMPTVGAEPPIHETRRFSTMEDQFQAVSTDARGTQA